MGFSQLYFARVGRSKLPQKFGQGGKVVTLRFGNRRHLDDYVTGTVDLQSLLQRGWSTEAFDLINVACALRAIDRATKSAGLFQVTRDLHLAVTVSDAQRWSQARELLQNAVAALSDDRLSFYPIKAGALPAEAFSTSNEIELLDQDGAHPDCVCLFSGGADSFAGAAHLLAKKRRPILISHSVGPISRRQRDLAHLIAGGFNLSGLPLVQARAYPRRHNTRPGWQDRDSLHRLRTIYFLSLAGVVAKAINLDDIFLCENGVIGAAVAFSPADDNPYTTRPAEPNFLRSMETFLRKVLQHPSLRIRNPFQYLTKGEALESVRNAALRRGLVNTVSCWRSGNQGVRNCGECVPCMFRQLAFDESGLPYTPGTYQCPIPTGKRWSSWQSEHLSRLRNVRRYCEHVTQGGKPWLFANEIAVMNAIDVTGGDVSHTHLLSARQQQLLDAAAADKIANMLVRFARATIARLPT